MFSCYSSLHDSFFSFFILNFIQRTKMAMPIFNYVSALHWALSWALIGGNVLPPLFNPFQALHLILILIFISILISASPIKEPLFRCIILIVILILIFVLILMSASLIKEIHSRRLILILILIFILILISASRMKETYSRRLITI